MFTRFNSNYLRSKDDVAFEELIRDLCALEWHDSNTQMHGRRGQKQYGVDVYGQPAELDGMYCAAQCKLRPSQKQLTKKQIEQEVTAARDFHHQLAKLIIATDTPRDTKVQHIVEDISKLEIANNGFKVEVWFWPDIERRIATYPQVLVKYYRDYLTSLTNLPILENLVDSPIRVLLKHLPPNTPTTYTDKALQFRGIKVVTELTDSSQSFGNLTNLQFDGVVIHVAVETNTDGYELSMKVLPQILSIEQQVGPSCPIFISSSTEVWNKITSADTLSVRSGKIYHLESSTGVNESADWIFSIVFEYGYRRRGMIPTVNIVGRSMSNQPNAALLDLNWYPHVTVKQHPSTEEWIETFAPALETVTSQLSSLKEATRLQISSEWPVPASVAIGYYLNIRSSILGVWARPMGKRGVKRLWLSDSDPCNIEVKEREYSHISSDSSSVAILEVATYFSIHPTVKSYVEQQEIKCSSWSEVLLTNDDTESQDIQEGHAVAFANYVGEVMRRLTSQGITDTHLFLRMPTALGILVGQRLHACGRVHLHWFDNTNSTYKPAFTLS